MAACGAIETQSFVRPFFVIVIAQASLSELSARRGVPGPSQPQVATASVTSTKYLFVRDVCGSRVRYSADEAQQQRRSVQTAHGLFPPLRFDFYVHLSHRHESLLLVPLEGGDHREGEKRGPSNGAQPSHDVERGWAKCIDALNCVDLRVPVVSCAAGVAVGV